ncbi:hypothetical protein E0H33_30140 [Rhizobium leguminosarum bv. viciae]|nr:hypothetical protein E0H33_30140 [Rhizobium leguminosarum bv. viciae]
MPPERPVGTERSRHIPFAPRAGVRRTGRDPWLDPGWCRQADEGLLSPISWRDVAYDCQRRYAFH